MEEIPVGNSKIQQGLEIAKDIYASCGVDVEQAIARADAIPVSMHCWQGDDVIGFDGSDSLSGGIQTTGNYPGRARTPDELRADIDKAFTLIPGKKKLNLHACYAEKNGKKVDRDAYTVSEFSGWLDWAKKGKTGLDFNPTYFSHPMMDGDFSLSSLAFMMFTTTNKSISSVSQRRKRDFSDFSFSMTMLRFTCVAMLRSPSLSGHFYASRAVPIR